jgi:hypothetical protein
LPVDAGEEEHREKKKEKGKEDRATALPDMDKSDVMSLGSDGST